MDYQSALKVFQQAEQDYQRTRKKTNADDLRWANEVLRKGTLADRIALAVSQLRESPAHNLSQFDYLLEISRSPVKRNRILVIPTIAKVCVENLLPKGSSLRTFKQFLAATANQKPDSEAVLRAVFEQQAKDKIASFVSELETSLTDPLSALRETALRACIALLFRSDEQCSRLLSAAVNRLADQDSRLAAFAVTKLVDLATRVRVRRAAFVEQLGHFLVSVTSTQRTNGTKPAGPEQRESRLAHGQYLAVCCLNQLIFRKDDESDRQLATRVARLYFSLFQSAVYGGAQSSERGAKAGKTQVAVEFDSRLICALLTGMQRAFVYADASAASLFDKQLGLLFRIVHSENMTVALQAFQVLYRLKQAEAAQSSETVELVGGQKKQGSVAERFYTALYGVLLGRSVPSSSKLPLFLNLVYKAVCTDPNKRRVRAFVTRLLIAAGRTPSAAFASAALILVSQIWKTLPHVTKFPALNAAEVQAQASAAEKQPEADSDEEEHFEDVPDDQDKQKASKKTSGTSSGTWIHRSMHNDSKPSAEDSETKQAERRVAGAALFEGTRNPKFAQEWELTCEHLLVRLTEHFHPSVAYFARQLLENGEPLHYDGDVFEDFTLSAFLRRFVLKNPPNSRKLDAKANRNMQSKRKRVALEARRNAKEHNGQATSNAADQHLVRLFAEIDDEGSTKRSRRRRDDEDITDREFDSYLAKYDRQYLGPDGEDDEEVEELDFADDVRSKMEADELERISGSKKRKRNAEEGSDSENELENASASDNDSDSEVESDSEFDDDASDMDEGLADGDQFNFDDEEDLDEDDEDNLEPMSKRSRGEKKKSKRDSLFADADDYAEMIEKDMNNDAQDDEEEEDAEQEEEGGLSHVKRKSAKFAGRRHSMSHKRVSKPRFAGKQPAKGAQRRSNRF